jgi:hypothetical protein
MDAAALTDIFQRATKAPLARGFFYYLQAMLAATYQ